MADYVDLAEAIKIANSAHRGQTDKAGMPYITHPARVASSLPISDIDGQCVAWLHDVMEDGDKLDQFLLRTNMPGPIVAAVEAITHRKHEKRHLYYERVRGNPIAWRVKLKDIADNARPDRLVYLSASTQERLLSKYAKALEALTP